MRTRNDIQLTPAGHRLLSHAENILSAWNRAKHDVAIDTEIISSLAIAGTPSLWDICLQDWLHMLHKKQPDLAIHAEVMDADHILRSVLEGTLDVGFTFEPPQVPQIHVQQIANIPLLMVSTQNKLNLEQALSENYVIVDWGISFSITQAKYFPNMVAPAIRLPLGRIALDYLLTCGGSAYLAKPTVAKALQNQRLFLIENAPVIERSAFAVYPADSQRIALIQEVLKLFKKV